MARALGLIGAGVTAALLVSPAAWAHQFEHPKVIRLGVQRDRLLVSLTYDVNPGEDARRLRALFDRDSDGRLDAEEQAKLARYLEETATLWIRVRVDGADAKLAREEATPHRLERPRESAETLGIALLYSAPLPAGPRVAIELSDREKDPSRHVPVTVDLAPGWDVEFANQGELYPDLRQVHRVGLVEGWPLRLHLTRTKP